MSGTNHRIPYLRHETTCPLTTDEATCISSSYTVSECDRAGLTRRIDHYYLLCDFGIHVFREEPGSRSDIEDERVPLFDVL